jgi:hypothetical protein
LKTLALAAVLAISGLPLASCWSQTSTAGIFGAGTADATDSTGPADGGSGSESGGAGFCASNPGHTLCDDFDDRENAAAGWTSIASGRGALSTDRARVRSAPRSLLAQVSPGPTSVNAAQVKRVVGGSSRIRVSFEVFIAAPTDAVGDSIASVEFSSGYLDLVWFTGGTLRLAEQTAAGAPAQQHTATAPLLPSQWVRVTMEVTPGRVRIVLGGASVVDEATTSTFEGPATLALGLFSDDGFGISANYDDLLVDTSF